MDLGEDVTVPVGGSDHVVNAESVLVVVLDGLCFGFVEVTVCALMLM